MRILRPLHLGFIFRLDALQPVDSTLYLLYCSLAFNDDYLVAPLLDDQENGTVNLKLMCAS